MMNYLFNGSNYGYGGWGMMNWIGGGFMMIAFWALLIILIVWIVREMKGNSSHKSSSDALDILKERYAKGEISKEEFEAKKKNLSN